MNHLLQLIWNENIKMIARNSTRIMVGSFIGIILIFFVFDRWYNPFYSGFWSSVAGHSWLSIFPKIFTVIMASRIIADEYQWGTIKLLLIRPVSRSKVLFSKYMAVLYFTGILLIFLFILSMLLNGVLAIFEEAKPAPELPSQGKTESLFGNVFLLYILHFIEVTIYGSIAFMLSALSKSVALSSGLTFFLMLFGSEIANQIGDMGIARFFLFHHTGLTKYAQTAPVELIFSLSESLTMILAYTFLFYLISWLTFTKRDVF